MALDAVAIRAVTGELGCLVGGRVDKIYQPERDEIVIHIRTREETYRLVISASTAHPRIHLTNSAKKNPATAPLFCMLLRKHIGGGRITAVEQPDFERMVRITIESYTELGELTEKQLTAEIMGRYSNIILIGADGRIIDSIKRIDDTVSSVRRILPGEEYTMPPAQDKTALIDFDVSSEIDLSLPIKAEKAIMASIAGISPLLAREIIYEVFRTTDVIASEINTNRAAGIKLAAVRLADAVRNNKFEPCLITDKNSKKTMDFSAVAINQYESLAKVERYDSINRLVDEFYIKRDRSERLRQKSADLTRLISANIERLSKKINVLKQTLSAAQDCDAFKTYGDLITANIYRLDSRMTEAELENFYDEECPVIKIKLDPSLSPPQNAQRYYKRYAKSKTAQREAARQLETSRAELAYMESTLAMTEQAETIEDISAIRAELAREGYIKRQTKRVKNRKEEESKPLHFVSEDGFDIYVGRNNTQNDYLTLKFANSGDLWFHTKDIHGSHTIIKLGTNKDVPPRTIKEAAQLAAYYSKARESSQVPVDYTAVKNVRKPSGAKPGMVIYEGQSTVYVTPKANL